MAINQGEVDIVLGDETLTLKPTLRAAKTVNAMSDGFVGALQALSRYNMAAFAVVIAAGLGKRSSAEVTALEEQVYVDGMDKLVAPLTRFVSILMNGGRDAEAEKEAAAGN